MKRKRFSVEQIAAVLKQADVGVPVAGLIRKAGISQQTLYRWKKHAGPEVDQVRLLMQLQEDNARLKMTGGRPDAGQGHAAGCALKKVQKPSQRHPVIKHWCEKYGVSERKGCGSAG